MIDPIILLSHEETFITLKCSLNVLKVRRHLRLDITFFSLQFIRSFIQRQNKKINCETQEYDSQALVPDYSVCNRKNEFKKQL